MHWSPRYYAAYRAVGGTLEFAAFDRLYKESDVEMAGRPEVVGLGFRAMIDLQVSVLAALLPRSDRGRIELRALAERFHADAVAAVRRNIPVLDGLARRYRLGIVSNFTGNLQRCLEELGLARLFATVSDSGVVGWTKPDARIFRHALAALGTSPDRAWMVGDNFEADIKGAAALGIRTCWLAPPDRVPAAADGPVPTARISRLPEIVTVLGEGGA